MAGKVSFRYDRFTEEYNRLMRWVMTVTLMCAFLVSPAAAIRGLVIIGEPLRAQRVEGIVLDPYGSPIPDMIVPDRTENCTEVLRTTQTDSKGHFHFATKRGKTVYCLRFDHPFWNPLQLTLKLDKRAPQRGITAKPEIGG